MPKVLVAFDGSESALRAVRYSIALAEQNGALSIHVVTVHEDPVIYGEIAVYVSVEKMRQLQRQHCESVIAPAEELLKNAWVPYTIEILVGRIAETIARHAVELGCDRVVMGTHGLTAIGSLGMGAVATKVIHLATMPVTLVK